MGRDAQNSESIDRFLKASGELMDLGVCRSGNIVAALESFKLRFRALLKTHFVERAVAEMMDKALSELEREVKDNVDDITKICTEGSQWYAFCFGTALGRKMEAPKTPEEPVGPQAKAKNS